METLTIVKTLPTTHLPESSTKSSKPRGLVAKWFMVDGKLTRKWLTAQM